MIKSMMWLAIVEFGLFFITGQAFILPHPIYSVFDALVLSNAALGITLFFIGSHTKSKAKKQ